MFCVSFSFCLLLLSLFFFFFWFTARDNEENIKIHWGERTNIQCDAKTFEQEAKFDLQRYNTQLRKRNEQSRRKMKINVINSHLIIEMMWLWWCANWKGGEYVIDSKHNKYFNQNDIFFFCFLWFNHFYFFFPQHYVGKSMHFYVMRLMACQIKKPHQNGFDFNFPKNFISGSNHLICGACRLCCFLLNFLKFEKPQNKEEKNDSNRIKCA